MTPYYSDDLVTTRVPWAHSFQPDPQTPSACAVCALAPAWHPEHQSRESDRYLSLDEQARLAKLRERPR